MNVEQIVAAGRAEAEALMVDSCLIGRQVGEVTDVDGNVTPTYQTVYEGRCKVQQTIAQSANPEAGNYQFTVQDLRLDVPVSAGPLRVDDTVTITAASLDPQLAGSVFRVVELFRNSMATAQRTRIEWGSG